MKTRDIKNKLRQDFLAKRVSLSNDDHVGYSKQLVTRLKEWLQKNVRHKIFLFYPYKSEPSLLSLAELLGQEFSFALPVVKAQKQMDFYSWNPSDKLMSNRYGIQEPIVKSQNLCKPDSNTVILVPAIACDSSGNRLGVGGGYYDRYLSRFPQALAVGVVFSCQLAKQLPVEANDVKLNHVFTENEQVL